MKFRSALIKFPPFETAKPRFVLPYTIHRRFQKRRVARIPVKDSRQRFSQREFRSLSACFAFRCPPSSQSALKILEDDIGPDCGARIIFRAGLIASDERIQRRATRINLIRQAFVGQRESRQVKLQILSLSLSLCVDTRGQIARSGVLHPGRSPNWRGNPS